MQRLSLMFVCLLIGVYRARQLHRLYCAHNSYIITLRHYILLLHYITLVHYITALYCDITLQRRVDNGEVDGMDEGENAA